MINKGRILVIDDDQQFLATMEDILNLEGYDPVCRTAHDQSVIVSNGSLPDVILIDYCLEGTDGGELCQKFRDDRQTAGIPLILISAYPQIHLPLDQIPFSVFIPKPFDLWEFLACLDELINR